MKTKLWAVILILFISVINALAQVFLKFGANAIDFSSLYSIIIDYNLWIGIFIYCIAGVGMIFAFRGGEVSLLYPLLASAYIFTLLFSKIFFNEALTSHKLIGVGIIIIGVILLGIGSKRNESIEYEVPL